MRLAGRGLKVLLAEDDKGYIELDVHQGAHMAEYRATDYETYREIMGELIKPILAEGLDVETLKSLYESKAVYLENLRIKSFKELNSEKRSSHFTWDDYHLVVRAIKENHNHVRNLILVAVHEKLDCRKAC